MTGRELHMSVDTREERLARRIADLYATDQQFADARPSEAITAAIDQPGLRLPQLVRTVMEGYADRPALGQRAVRFVNDPQTGRTSVELLPRFETISYRELWDRVGAVATALAGGPSLGAARRSRLCAGLHQRRLHDSSTWRWSRWARCPFRCRPARPLPNCGLSSPRPSRA